MTRPVFIAIAGIVIVGFAFILNFQLWQDDVGETKPEKVSATAEEARPQPVPEKSVSTPSVKAPKPALAQSEPAVTKQHSLIAPTFDVARVNPKGEALMAGRAEPNGRIFIMDNEQDLGHVMSDRRGEWVFVPEARLKPGTHQLKLRMEIEGSKPIFSSSNVVVVVPTPNMNIAGEPTRKKSGVLALKVPSQGHGPVTVLQKPKANADSNAPSSGKGDNWIVVDAVDYDDKGKLSISGHAAPNAPVNIYLSNKFVGQTKADEKGAWYLTPTSPVTPGLYRLRADRIGQDGKVLARVEFSFERAKPIKDLKEGAFIIVQPGNSLWRLARRTYGSGFAYTVIFEANQDKIGDPNLIHPGQVFTLPNTK
jgi:nucleoid-associated protein YgaU